MGNFWFALEGITKCSLIDVRKVPSLKQSAMDVVLVVARIFKHTTEKLSNAKVYENVKAQALPLKQESWVLIFVG